MANLAVKSILYYDSSVTTADGDLASYANGATENEITGVGRVGRVLLRIKNTAAAKAFAIKASDVGPNKGIGDISLNLKQNQQYELQLEAARFLNSDGQIQFTCAASATGTISATQMLD